MTTENRCPGGCGAAGDCDCYGSGYANGKDKSHFEMRTWDGSHPPGCDCDPCVTATLVSARLAGLIVEQVLVEDGLDPDEAKEETAKIMASDEARAYTSGSLPQIIMGLHRYAVRWAADDRGLPDAIN